MRTWTVRTIDGTELSVEADHVDMNPTPTDMGAVVVRPFVLFTVGDDAEPVAVFPTGQVSSIRRSHNES